MRTVRRSVWSIVVVACVAAAGLTGCTPSERSPRSAPDFPGDGCAPIGDTHLVELIDDKKLLVAGNIVPVVTGAVTEKPLMEALNRVSNSLDQFSLIRLNRATAVDRKPPETAAVEYAEHIRLTKELTQGSGRRIVVGTAVGAESETIAHLYRIVLAGAGYAATVQVAGDRTRYVPALLRGEIHLAPDYVGPLTDFLNRRVNGSKAAPIAGGDLKNTMAELTRLGAKVPGQGQSSGPTLVFGKPADAGNQTGFAITKALADKYHIRTLSEFTEECSGHQTVLGAAPECKKDRLCLAGLENSYGLAVGGFSALDAGGPRTKAALRDGSITIGSLSTSDAVLAT